MAEATPATAVPDANPLGSKHKKVSGSKQPWLGCILVPNSARNHPGVKINKEAMQVWAEALDTWLQKLAQQVVPEHTSQILTLENVQATLQLLLAKNGLAGSKHSVNYPAIKVGLTVFAAQFTVVLSTESQVLDVAYCAFHRSPVRIFILVLWHMSAIRSSLVAIVDFFQSKPFR